MEKEDVEKLVHPFRRQCQSYLERATAKEQKVEKMTTAKEDLMVDLVEDLMEDLMEDLVDLEARKENSMRHRFEYCSVMG